MTLQDSQDGEKRRTCKQLSGSTGSSRAKKVEQKERKRLHDKPEKVREVKST